MQITTTLYANSFSLNVPEMKLVEDAQKSDRLSSNEVEVKAISENVQH